MVKSMMEGRMAAKEGSKQRIRFVDVESMSWDGDGVTVQAPENDRISPSSRFLAPGKAKLVVQAWDVPPSDEKAKKMITAIYHDVAAWKLKKKSVKKPGPYDDAPKFVYQFDRVPKR